MVSSDRSRFGQRADEIVEGYGRDAGRADSNGGGQIHGAQNERFLLARHLLGRTHRVHSVNFFFRATTHCRRREALRCATWLFCRFLCFSALTSSLMRRTVLT